MTGVCDMCAGVMVKDMGMTEHCLQAREDVKEERDKVSDAGNGANELGNAN